jgi:peptide-methionine (S)-S-oxide reductase
MINKIEKATFGAGCFWGVEAAFMEISGVINTACGYSGGNTKNPTYKEVCTGKTGHAEVVDVEFNPSEVSYKELLELFWKIHDPTTLDRQGPDFGTQYRSVIFFHNSDQEKIAIESKEQLEKNKIFKNKIVTEIKPQGDFYKAEEYHQKYFEKNGIKACH